MGPCAFKIQPRLCVRFLGSIFLPYPADALLVAVRRTLVADPVEWFTADIAWGAMSTGQGKLKLYD